MNEKICPWALNSEVELKYHNDIWCRITKDEREIFEFLVLEFMQAGLSWRTILNKKEFMREEFDNFDYIKISKYDDNKKNRIMKNENIIRNKLKINALVNNAQRFIEIQEEFGSFYNYIWQYTDFKKIKNNFKFDKDRESESELSKKISKDLKKRGFKFIGSKIIYSFLEAIGVYNNHLTTCKFYDLI